jgi:hypothetical protein
VFNDAFVQRNLFKDTFVQRNFSYIVEVKLPCRSSSEPLTTFHCNQWKNHIRKRIRKLSGICVEVSLIGE